MSHNSKVQSITRDDAAAAVAALREAKGNVSAAARNSEMDRSAFRRRLAAAKRWGMFGLLGGELPEGLHVGSIKTLSKPDGPVLQWVTELVDNRNKAIEENIQAVMSELPSLPEVDLKSRNLDLDRMTVYPIVDHHLGMYGWKKETGENYDVKIAEELLDSTFVKLLQRTPNSQTATLLVLGDFFDRDNDDNRTRRSGNRLDGDTRWANVLLVGVAMIRNAAIRAAEKHEKVELVVLQGNHDEYGALALMVALAESFRDNPRITVNLNKSYYWMQQFGKVMLVATHGDMCRPTEIAGVSAAYWPKVWGSTEYRYAFLGHIHHTTKKTADENNGMTWETFMTLSPKNAWMRRMGYRSGRGMVGITYHKDEGEETRNIVNIKGAQW